jgi:hypothetical protein
LPFTFSLILGMIFPSNRWENGPCPKNNNNKKEKEIK